MANILVYIEVTDDEATPASLITLNKARLLASHYGATLYAMLPCMAPPAYGENDIIAVLSRSGADKIILITHPAYTQLLSANIHTQAVTSVCEQFSPKLLLFPASEITEAFASHLTGELKATFYANVRVTKNDSTYRLIKDPASQNPQNDISMLLQKLIILTLIPEDPVEIMGKDDAEVIILHEPTAEFPAVSP